MDSPASTVGLRARKKQQTRERIASTARHLFEKRGYDAVTVAQVAVTAGLSEATVFNYFPTKDELFFGAGLEQFQARMLDAIRDRPAGESAVAAFIRFTLENIRHGADPNAAELILAAARILASSPSLQARERELIAATTDALAEGLEPESRSRFEAWVVANALMGVQRAIVAEVRAEVLAGRPTKAVTIRVRRHATLAFRHLASGLG
jgi:AcrR family transcriptional regulator